MKSPVVIVTSTLYPTKHNWYGVVLDPSVNRIDRVEETLNTLRNLKKIGLNDIYLIDNSLTKAEPEIIHKLQVLRITYLWYPSEYRDTENKGLLEIDLILRFLDEHPCNRPILKISGRYLIVNDDILIHSGYDIVGRVFKTRRGFYEFSTKLYLVKNSEVLKKILNEAVKQVCRSAFRFHSLFLFSRFIRFCRASISEKSFNVFRDPPVSIEEGFFYAIKKSKLDACYLDVLGVSGKCAADGKFVSE